MNGFEKIPIAANDNYEKSSARMYEVFNKNVAELEAYVQSPDADRNLYQRVMSRLRQEQHSLSGEQIMNAPFSFERFAEVRRLAKEKGLEE
jgi:hypothetical protein